MYLYLRWLFFLEINTLQAAVLAQMARDEKVTGVIGQVLNIPVTCHPKLFPSSAYEYFSYSQNKDASVVDAPKMDWFWDQYMPEPKPDSYASPLLAKDLSGLPPVLLQVAGMDPLRDEGLAYAEKLEVSGVKVQVKRFQGVPHGFYMFLQLKATREYFNNVVTFVKSLNDGSAL
jgi:acetyl esterase/lipase